MQRRSHSIFTAVRRASPFDRVGAQLFDLLVAAAAFSVGNAVYYFLGVSFCFLYLLLKDGWGPSIGKRLFGLRVLQDSSATAATPAQSALRNFPFGMGILFIAIPAFWVFFILVFIPLLFIEFYFIFRLESGLRLGDVLAVTYVCDSLRQPRPMDPYTPFSDDSLS
jgi:uncharacterized RDD family membrane protein YckC